MSGTSSEREHLLVRKITFRILPILWCGYAIAFLDRVNVSFASLQMNDRLGFSSSVYGLGAGLFFIGYTICEVPSNIFLHKLGARVWLARIMVLWGVLSAASIFVRSPGQFYFSRLLLGVGEAGFFPGVIFYLGRWIPSSERARCISYFMSAAAVAGILGAVISGMILSLDGLGGLQGWQWLFLLEGLPAIVLGVIVFFLLPESPAKATWLESNDRSYISKKVGTDVERSYSIRDIGKKLCRKDVVYLSFIYFCLVFVLYGFGFWIPQVVRRLFGGNNLAVGFIVAIPSAVSLVAMLLASRYSDLTGRRVKALQFCITVSLLASIGLFLAQGSARAVVVCLISLAVAGIWGALGPFWALATTKMKGIEGAASVAAINSIGNLGGFLAPIAVARLTGSTQAVWPVVMVLVCIPILRKLVMLAGRHDR